MITAALSISLLILAVPPAGSIAGPSIAGPVVGRIVNPSYSADEIAYHGDFGPEGDRNRNGWPDDWRRRVGPGFPRYVTMSLAADASAPGGDALRVDLNGAAATAYSPPIAISPAHVYTLTVAVKTEKLRHDQAYVSLRLLDAEEKQLSEQVSDRVTGDSPWRLLQLGPLALDDARVRFAVVGLHVQPGEPADLTGRASFADVRVLRQPRLRVTTNRPFNLFATDEPVTITCQASGLPASSDRRRARLSLEVIRHVDESLPDSPARLGETRPGDETNKSSFRTPPPSGETLGEGHLRRESPLTPSLSPTGRGGYETGSASEQPVMQDWDVPPERDDARPREFTWSPRLPGAGYYRLRARLVLEAADQPIAGSTSHGQHYVGRISNPSDTTRVLAEYETSLAVVPRLKKRSLHNPGSFGWSLPRAKSTIPPTQLADLADRVGVSLVKLPVWGDVDTSAAQQQPKPSALRALLDALAARDVQVVGVLTDPPAQLRQALFGDAAADASAASLLAAPAAKLRPQLETVMTPLALQIRDWQLGDDTDRSLASSQLPVKAIRELQAGLAKDGLPVRLALPAPLAAGEEGQSDGLKTCFIPAATAPTEIETALRGRHAARQPTWLTIEPPQGDRQSPGQRAADFAQRLVIAATHAERVFVHEPLEPHHGLLNADGSPGDLLLPWYTVASQLSGAKLLGRLQLPSGSDNAVWERDGRVSLVLWSGEPRTERMFVGRGARQLDLQGQVTALPVEGAEQVIRVGAAPSFVIGADAAVLRTQLAVTVEPARLPSIPSLPQHIRVRVPNCFGRAIAGKVTLHLPERWRVVSAKSVAIDLPTGGEATTSFQARLPLDGASGPQELRVELEIAGEPPLHFSVCRQLQADGGDVELTATARLDEQGNLIVRQQLTNRGATAVGFTCQLSIPGRRPQRVTLRRLSPGTHEHAYTVPDGRELLDKKLRLRADETGGQRVLSQSVVPAR